MISGTKNIEQTMNPAWPLGSLSWSADMHTSSLDQPLGGDDVGFTIASPPVNTSGFVPFQEAGNFGIWTDPDAEQPTAVAIENTGTDGRVLMEVSSNSGRRYCPEARHSVISLPRCVADRIYRPGGKDMTRTCPVCGDHFHSHKG